MKKLVFIDDDPIDHFVMKHVLRARNFFDTTYTVDGSLVLDYIEENKDSPEKLPDLIFLDLNMPQYSGWEFLERMQKLHCHILKDIHVYVLSSSLRPADRETSSRYSFVSEFISKPVNTLEMQRIVGQEYPD
jgi:CheY-like chemotaxis protein